MGREVAIKTSGERFSDRFSGEVHAVAALNHPNICAVYDVGESAGCPFLVMELLDGKTLANTSPSTPSISLLRSLWVFKWQTRWKQPTTKVSFIGI